MIDILDHFVSHVRSKMANTLEPSQVVRQAIKPGSPTKIILVQIYDGEIDRFPPRQDMRVVIIAQDTNDEGARKLIMEFINNMPEDYDHVLSPPTGVSPSPSAVTLAQMKPLGFPQPLGDQGNGRFWYSIPYMLKLKV